MTCELGYVKDVATMLLTVPDERTGTALSAAAAEKLISPFCAAEKADGQAAAVVLTVQRSQKMRVINCETGEMTPWQQADPAAEQLQRVASACEAIENSRYRGLGCGMSDVNGTPSLVIRYDPNSITADELLEVGRVVTPPFCAATSSSGVAAAVFLVETRRDGLATGLDCSDGTVSQWRLKTQSGGGPSGAPSTPRRRVGYESITLAKR